MGIPSTREEIVWRLHLASPPDRVFELIASDAGRESFWCETSQTRGETIRMTFVNGIETETAILEAAPPARLRLRYFDSEVEFALAPDGKGGTDLILRNRGVEAEEYEEVLAGWLNVLLPLKAAADFGIDLRSRDPARTWEEGYVDQ